MKDLTNFRGDIWTISQTIIQYSLSIRVGYPIYAVNKNAFVGVIEYINQGAKQALINENFDDEHIFFSLLNQLVEDFEVFIRINIQAGKLVVTTKFGYPERFIETISFRSSSSCNR
jgi:hypothetical protein